jgi:hypothetical protein
VRAEETCATLSLVDRCTSELGKRVKHGSGSSGY